MSSCEETCQTLYDARVDRRNLAVEHGGGDPVPAPRRRVPATFEVPAVAIRSGDYLPPQRVLDGTCWQEQGVMVAGAVLGVPAKLPVVSGRVLLFGPAGAVRSIPRDMTVSVRRPPPPGPAPAAPTAGK